MKIGDIVDFYATNELIGTGMLLGISSDHPLCKFWMVLILKRYTDFLKACPELALNLVESYLKPSNVTLTRDEMKLVYAIRRTEMSDEI